MRTLGIISLLFGFLISGTAFAFDPRDEARHKSCVRLTEMGEKGVFQALEESGRWLQDGGGAPAYHCQAMAFLAAELYVDAALRFLEAAKEPDVDNNKRLAKIYAQAGNAWMLAHNYRAALDAFIVATELIPGNKEAWVDRAQALFLLKDDAAARKDLSYVLSLQADHQRALILLSRIDLRQEAYLSAWHHIHRALEADPFKVELLLLRGEIAEAMRTNNIEVQRKNGFQSGLGGAAAPHYPAKTLDR